MIIPILIAAIPYILIGLWIANFTASYLDAKYELEGKTHKKTVRKLKTLEEAQRRYTWMDKSSYDEWVLDHPSDDEMYNTVIEEVPVTWDDSVYGRPILVMSIPFLWPVYVIYLAILQWPIKAFGYIAEKMGNVFFNSGTYLAKELVNPKKNVKKVQS